MTAKAACQVDLHKSLPTTIIPARSLATQWSAAGGLGYGVGQASAPNVEYVQNHRAVWIGWSWALFLAGALMWTTTRSGNFQPALAKGPMFKSVQTGVQLCALRSNGGIDCWSYYTSSISQPRRPYGIHAEWAIRAHFSWGCWLSRV